MALANHLSGLPVKGADLERVAVYILAVRAACLQPAGNHGRFRFGPPHVVVQPLLLGTCSAESLILLPTPGLSAVDRVPQ